MTLSLAQQILGAFPAPVFGCLRGQNSKDLTVRQIAVLLAVEALGSVTTEQLVASLPGTHAQLARPLDQLLDRLLLSHREGRWSITIKGTAVLDSAPDRLKPRAPTKGDLLYVETVTKKQVPVQPKPTGAVLLVQEAEQAVARAELLHKDQRSPRTFELLNAAYDDLDAARQAAREEAKPGPKARPKKPKHKED